MPNDTTPLFGYFAFHDGQWHPSNADDPCSVKLYRRTTDGAQGAIDLDKLEALARAADPIYTDLYGDRHAQGAWSRTDLTGEQDAFVTAITPTAVLDLIALARRAAPVQEAVTRESALHAINHLDRSNSPGRSAEAVAMLVLPVGAAEKAEPTAYMSSDGPKVLGYYTEKHDAENVVKQWGGKVTPLFAAQPAQACSAQVATKFPLRMNDEGNYFTMEQVVSIQNTIQPGDGWAGDDWDFALTNAVAKHIVSLAAPATPQVGWISVKDRIPEDSLAVLVNRADWDRACIAAHFDAKGGNEAHWQDEEGEDFHETPEYWMPIPGLRAPATGAEGAQQQTEQQPQANVLPPFAEPAGQRDALYRAAINCGHSITDGVVKLYSNPKLPGNALSQLADRLEAELASRGRAQGGNTQANSAYLSQLTRYEPAIYAADAGEMLENPDGGWFKVEDVRTLLATHQPSTQAEGK